MAVGRAWRQHIRAGRGPRRQIRHDMTVLIVDDNPQVRALIRTLLTGLADDIRECADGDDAVAAYRQQRADWVLMDAKMVRMGGLEATRRIVASDRTARVLIVTDYDDAHWRAAASEAGACGYVLKDNLLEVRRLLREAHEGD
jgi:CheY-like chemotaxis protein